MGFFQDLADSISGKPRQELAAAQLQAQIDAVAAQQAQDKAELEAKMSPEAIRARSQKFILVASITGSLLLLLMLGKIFKWF